MRAAKLTTAAILAWSIGCSGNGGTTEPTASASAASKPAPYHSADGGFGSTGCTNGIDDDGDGLVDSNDPECTGALDDDEATFATGIPGDNVDPCKQDCFFDGNSGQGDDRCEWNLKCDPLSTAPKCGYDASQKHCATFQPPACLDACLGITPNGCDCFGCCAIPDAAGVVHTVRLTGSCTLATLDDPTKCAACTQQASCLNPCGRCELCVGKTELPADCVAPPPDDAGVVDGPPGAQPTDASIDVPLSSDDGGAPPKTDDAGVQEGCAPDQVACDPAVPCAPGYWCLTGCCVPVLK